MSKFAETEDETLLRRVRETVAACKLAEDEARKALVSASESTKRAREKLHDLFIAVEARAVARVRANQ